MASKNKVSTTSYKEWLLEKLKDPKEAQGYLEVTFEEYMKDGDIQTFLLALRDVVEARCGTLGELASKTKLNRQHLYKVLSTKGNPQMNTIFTIMNALGFQITFKFKPIKKAA